MATSIGPYVTAPPWRRPDERGSIVQPTQTTPREISRRAVLLGAAGGAATAACSPFGGTVDDAGGAGKNSVKFITPADLGLERELYTGFIREFEKANQDYKVTVTFEAWDDYMTKLPTLFAGGAVPDLLHQHMSIVQDYGHRGALLDLAPLMKRDGIDRNAFVPSLFDAFTDGDKVYGIPKDSAAWGVYYNKDKFDEAGVEYPRDDWTLDDFHATARTLTRDKAGRQPGTAGFHPKQVEQWGLSWLPPTPTDSENTRALVRALGGDWYDASYTRTHVAARPAVELFETFRQMRCVDVSMPSPALDLGQGDPFRSGLTAMVVGFHNVDFFLRQEKAKFAWDVTFLPGGPDGQFVPVGCSGWAIAAGAKHPDAAWELLKHLVSKEVQRKIAAQKRWGPSIRDAMTELVPEGAPSGFVKVHVDPLRDQSDRDVITLRFPPGQSKIKQIYASNFDPIWTTCSTDDVAGAARKTARQVDAVLAAN